TPYLELQDGTTIAACDGADEIEPIASTLMTKGPGLNQIIGMRVIWKRWALIEPDKTNVDLPFGEAEKFIEPGLQTEVVWKTSTGSELTRAETITSSRPVTVRRFRM